MTIDAAIERPLTTKEVSAATGIPENTLAYWRWARTGPPSYKLGHRRVYDPSELRKWMAEQRACSS